MCDDRSQYQNIQQYQYMLKNIISKGVYRYLFCSGTKAIEAPKKFSQLISKARAVMPLYKLEPKNIGDVFIAPNSTVVGQVYMGNRISIGHGTVIRGDINSVYLHSTIIIGDNCVLHTAPCLPSGLPAELEIGQNCIISSGCTLYSCNLQSKVFIGSNSVILEGARLQSGCIILPNSVVPPGRVVPANQVWGGNPIKFVRFAMDQQSFVTRRYSQQVFKMTQGYKQQFIAFNNAYLYKKSDPENDKITSHQFLTQFKIIDDGHYNPNNPTI